MKKLFLLLLIPILLIGCDYATQTRYGYSEVGQVQVVQFGTVIAIRDIEIMGESSVGGAIAGGAAGAAAGQEKLLLSLLVL